jgi:hypothetical protein
MPASGVSIRKVGSFGVSRAFLVTGVAVASNACKSGARPHRSRIASRMNESIFERVSSRRCSPSRLGLAAPEKR